MSHAYKLVWTIRRRSMTASKTQNAGVGIDENKNISVIRSHRSLAYSRSQPNTYTHTQTHKIKATKMSDSFRVNAAVKRSKCKLPFLVHRGVPVCALVRWMCLPSVCCGGGDGGGERFHRLVGYIHISVFTEHCSSDDVIFASLFAQFSLRRITTTITKRYDGIIQCETILYDAHWADEHTPFHIFIHIVNTLRCENRFSGFTWNDSPSGWRML